MASVTTDRVAVTAVTAVTAAGHDATAVTAVTAVTAAVAAAAQATPMRPQRSRLPAGCDPQGHDPIKTIISYGQLAPLPGQEGHVNSAPGSLPGGSGRLLIFE